MKDIFGKKFKEYGGLITYTILFTYLIFNLPKIFEGGKSLLGIISPFIVGIAIAFVLNLLMKVYERNVLKFFDNKKYNKYVGLKRPIAITLTILSIIAFIIGLTIFIIPQLADSVSSLTNAIPGYIDSFEKFINQYFTSTELLNNLWNSLLNVWKEVLQLTGQILATSVSSAVNITVSLTSGVVNFLLALVFAIYMLASKERLINQIKKVLNVLLKKKIAEKVICVGQVVNESFASFIGGQCIEAVIISILCFIGMVIFRMPYPLLISVIVGVTSLIPIFGAFIGTIPAAFIILILDPMKAVWFIVFIVVLQQIEGNLIYPKVVGESVGLPPIFVMLSMIVGGSTLGLLGMLIGIPTCSVFYRLFKEYINKRYNEEKIPKKEICKSEEIK